VGGWSCIGARLALCTKYRRYGGCHPLCLPSSSKVAEPRSLGAARRNADCLAGATPERLPGVSLAAIGSAGPRCGNSVGQRAGSPRGPGVVQGPATGPRQEPLQSSDFRRQRRWLPVTIAAPRLQPTPRSLARSLPSWDYNPCAHAAAGPVPHATLLATTGAHGHGRRVCRRRARLTRDQGEAARCSSR